MSVKKDWNSVEGSKNQKVPHPDTGLLTFGYIYKIQSNGETIHPGPIILKIGKHLGPNRGFGINHIWDEHKRDLEKAGYTGPAELAVTKFVADIIKINASIYCEFRSLRGNHRPTILRSSVGIAIIEPFKAEHGEIFYSVVTAFPKKIAHGTKIGTIKKAPDNEAPFL